MAPSERHPLDRCTPPAPGVVVPSSPVTPAPQTSSHLLRLTGDQPMTTSPVTTALHGLGRGVRRAGRGQRRLWAAAGRASAELLHPGPLVALLLGHLFGAVLLYLTLPIGDPGLDGFLLLLAALVVVVGLVADPGGPVREDNGSWWAERRLVRALVDAGVLPAPRKDEPLPALSRHGQPRHDATGTSVVFALPLGRTAEDCARAHARLSGCLGIAADRLRVAPVEGAPANVVRFTELAPRRTSSEAAEVSSLTRTRWADPVRIGSTELGQPVHLATDEANTLLAGQPGAGKTTVARTVLGHYLLDPAALVYGLDGKGSRRDYGSAVPLCAGWVWGTSDDARGGRRGAAGRGARHRPGAQRLGRRARGRLARCPAAAGGVPGRAGRRRQGHPRAPGRHPGPHRPDGPGGGRLGPRSTQRPSVDDLPAGVRNLVGQRLALMLRNGADAALVLGTTPELALPTRRGQALLTTPTGTVGVELDLLDGPAWEALCARAAALRPSVPAPPVEPVVEALEPAPEPVEPEPLLDPLLAEVLALLADGPPRGMPAAALLERLPAWLAPPTPAALGKALRAHPGHVQPGHAQGGTRVWRAVTTAPSGAPGAVVAPSSPRLPAAVQAPGDGAGAAPHAQTAPAPAVPSSPSSSAGRLQ